MSVATETSAVEYDGNGATTQFPVPFPFLEDELLVVISTVTATGVASTLTLNTGYTVSGAGNATGTVTTTVAPATGVVLRIERTVELVQSIAYRSQGNFSPATHEDSFDYLTYICQQLNRRLAAVEALGNLVPITAYTHSLVAAQFTTAADPGATWPVTVAMPAGGTVTGCKVVRARNLTAPTSIFQEPPQVFWGPNGSGLDILYCSGLDGATEYLLNLEVTVA